MALVLETGSGVRGANSYVTAAFVTAYLTDRNRQTENGWSTSTTQDAACIAASDYIDTRWGARFNGVRRVRYTGSQAQAVIRFTTIPVDDDTLTVGEMTYTFKNSIETLGINQILIGANVADTIDNLLSAVAVDSTYAGTRFSNSTAANTSVGAALHEGTVDEVIFTAVLSGLAGNDIPLAEEGAVITLLTATFQNGFEAGTQPMEFPRASLIGYDGIAVTGVPVQLKNAAAEYAVRAAGALLYRDPTVSDSGRSVVEERVKIGPIEEEFVYEDGAGMSALIKPYPAADAWLQEYLKPAGAVIR